MGNIICYRTADGEREGREKKFINAMHDAATYGDLNIDILRVYRAFCHYISRNAVPKMDDAPQNKIIIRIEESCLTSLG